MLRLTLALAIGVLSTYVTNVSADSERPPFVHITTSWSGRYYFKMVPTGLYIRRDGPAADTMPLPDGVGAAYEVGPEQDKKLWVTRGWYAHSVYLSDDGRFLVRMGNWPFGSGPSEHDLAVAFYDNGKLAKQYSTKDLIKDNSKVSRSLSHYQYIHPKGVLGFVGPSDTDFSLTTIDGITYVFNIETGEIVSKKKGR